MSTHCPECGHTFDSSDANEAQARINDLSTQVRLLNSKASTYIERLQDYEEEIQSLRAQCAQLQREKQQTSSATIPASATEVDSREEITIPPPPPAKDTPAQRTVNRQSLSRLSSLTSYLPGRRKDSASELPAVPPLHTSLNRSTPNLATPTTEYMQAPSPPTFATNPTRQGQSLTLIGLQTKLEDERKLREQAESSLAQSQNELEELTAQLFGQANEMVATERKARAKLEERVKLLETRDGEKRRRLERLEKAVERIERVRRMVVDHEKEMGDEAYTQTEVIQGRKITNPIPFNASIRRNDHARFRRKVKEEVVSEEEAEENEGLRQIEIPSENFEDAFEFDVRLKVWRRSRANIWRVPTFS